MGFYTRLHTTVEKVVGSKKLTNEQKADVLHELMFHLDAMGSLQVQDELMARPKKEHAGVYHQTKADLFQSAKRINAILSPTGIEWEGTGMNEDAPEVKAYLDPTKDYLGCDCGYPALTGKERTEYLAATAKEVTAA